MGKFVHLHLHTEYSLLDGCCRLITGAKHDVFPLRQALLDRGMNAVAITDHGNMYGVYSFVSSLAGSGIKPIIGEEFYTCEDIYDKRSETLHQRNHLILLAKNEEGYHNLTKLSSIAFIDGFYGKPRIDLNILRKHSNGLICCSACIAGAIPQYLLGEKYEKAKEYAITLRDMFAPGDFYIELQDHGIDEELRVRNDLVRIAKEIGVKVVATNDVHYIEKEDADAQDDMMCVQLNCKKNEINPVRFDKQEFYLKTAEEMEELFAWCPEAIESTLEIAEKCNFEFQLRAKKNLIPPYTSDDLNGRSADDYLHDIAYEGIKKRYPVITKEIKERLDYELSTIQEMGYSTYFLIVWDYVNAAKKMDIPVGPGRGSGVGSIVAYSIGITDVDPLRFGLLFERFLSKERVSMPDFDVDFCYVRRGEVLDYVTKKYGRDNVSQICSYGTMKAKAAVKDIARIYDVSFEESNKWAKTMSKAPNADLKGCLDPNSKFFSPEFKQLYDEDPRARDIINRAMKIEGLPRQMGMHACGVVICATPITDYVPLARNKENIITQFDKTQVEPLGMLKMDFLGLTTLTDIKEAIKYIKEDKGVNIDFDKIGFDDPKVYELISSGDCKAVFQLESGGMCDFMSRLKPTTLEEVIAGISLYRPGPMQFIDKYIEGKHHPETVTYLHESMKSILSVTYGCMIYQEQIMQITRKLAGYSFGGADILRRAISKKKAEIIERNKEVFAHGGIVEGDRTNTPVVGALANGVSQEVVDEFFDQLTKFADYCFNKSHAAAYAVLSYRTAYLKCYYPIHFITAIINNRIGKADEQTSYINYLKKIGIKVIKPDINKSKKNFSIDGNDVRFGLMGIKNVGEAAIETVLKERNKNGPFKDIRDFFERCGDHINSRMVESMILGGVFDSFGKNRATLMASYKGIMADADRKIKNQEIGQFSIFDIDGSADMPINYIEMQEFAKDKILSDEKNNLGMYLSGHPLDDYLKLSEDFSFDTSKLVLLSEDENDDDTYVDEETESNVVYDESLAGQTVTFGCIVSSWEKKKTKKNQQFAVGELEDLYGTLEFTMFPTSYEKALPVLLEDRPVVVTGKIDMKGSEPKIIIDEMELWRNYRRPTVEQKQTSQVVYVLISKEQQGLLKGIASNYSGEDILKLVMVVDGAKKTFIYPRGIHICDDLLTQLKNLVGEKNVKIKD